MISENSGVEIFFSAFPFFLTNACPSQIALFFSILSVNDGQFPKQPDAKYSILILTQPPKTVPHRM